MAEIETLTAGERYQLAEEPYEHTAQSAKAVRIIDAQGECIGEQLALLVEARELIARAYIASLEGTTIGRELAEFLSRVDASGRRVT